MRAGVKWGLGLFAGFAVAGGVMSAVNPEPGAGPEPGAVASVPVAAAPGSEPAVLSSAADVVREAGELFPIPNPRDTTTGCLSYGCVQRITTDRVTVTQMENDQAAAEVAENFAIQDARAAGRFVLTFAEGGSSGQQFTSDEARDAFEVRARELSGS